MIIPDIIGTIYDQVDEETVIEKEGFHVNFPETIPELEAYRVKPKTPYCVYMGVETFCYVFDSESDFYAAYPDAVPPVEVDDATAD